jgi:hypothetical protein
MRAYSLTELFNLTRTELFTLHARIVTEIAELPENSGEQSVGFANLQKIRRVLARKGPEP